MFIPVWVLISLFVGVVMVLVCLGLFIMHKLTLLFEKFEQDAIEKANEKYYSNVKILQDEVNKIEERASSIDNSSYWDGFMFAVELFKKAVESL